MALALHEQHQRLIRIYRVQSFFQDGRLWMGHFWSLAIEEQFYLVWPMVILLLSRAAAMKLCVMMVIGAPLVRVGLFSAFEHPVGLWATMYFTLSKVDTLALGALLALTARSPGGLAKFARLAPYSFAVALFLLAPLLVLKWPKHTLAGGMAETIKLSRHLSVLRVDACAGRQQWTATGLRVVLHAAGDAVPRKVQLRRCTSSTSCSTRCSTGRWLGVEAMGRRLGSGWHVTILLHILVCGLISVGVRRC